MESASHFGFAKLMPGTHKYPPLRPAKIAFKKFGGVIRPLSSLLHFRVVNDIGFRPVAAVNVLGLPLAVSQLEGNIHFLAPDLLPTRRILGGFKS